MKKHKAIAIPVSFHDGTARFLTVRDKRFKEWIFVTGGCRRREIFNPLRTALRELEEETRGVVSLKKCDYTHYSFTVKESPTVDLEYNVFIFFVNYSRTDQQELIRRFNEEKHKMHTKKINMKRTYDENDFMSFDSNMWMATHVSIIPDMYNFEIKYMNYGAGLSAKRKRTTQ